MVINKIRVKGKTLAFSRFSESLIRVGYGVRGLIYVVMGLLAVNVALGVAQSLSDPSDAIAFIGQQITGQILLFIVLIGLVGYSSWGLIRTFFDPLNKGKSFNGIFVRAGFFVSAVAYAVLIPPTYNFVFGMPKLSQGSVLSTNLGNIISTVFLLPFGRLVVGIIGLVILGISLFNIYREFHHSLDEQIKPYALSHKQLKIIKVLGNFGTSARSVVSALIGLFLLFASYQANPQSVRGIDGALFILMRQPYGSWVLGIVALGLISFGLYSLLEGFWFKFKK